jgi:trk system potassium uptake protein TrkA
VGATGDDKVNLVVSLLAKTEFAVNRVVARINHPANEWLFTESWGVDVAVSTPRVLASLVEEAVEVGDIVRLFGIREGQANLVELTLPDNAPCAGRPVRDLALPKDSTLVGIVRGRRVITPSPEEPLEAGDELLFVALPEAEPALRRSVLPS